ncbi:MAG: hypothetical protein ACYC9O_20645 [Candidatus Latescibacterota bacterium]
MLVLLLTGGASGDCFSVEPAAPAPEGETGVDETEQISPDYALERSEQKFLRYEGKRIVSIRIKRLEVFDSSVQDTTGVKTSRLEKALNRVNFNTRDTTIRQSLLFEEGDYVDPYVLADSERLLRYLDFIKDARIVVMPDKADSKSVSVLVIVKEQWSLLLTGGLKKGNGFKADITERNILGRGHQISSSFTIIPQAAPRFGMGYSVQNIKGSFITGNLTYLKVPQINSVGLDFSRELVSPVLTYSGGLELRRTSAKINDSLPFFSDNAYNLFDLWAGKTIRLEAMKKDIDRRRSLVISGRFRRINFTTHPDVTDSTWYRYHDVRHYIGNIAFIQHRYYRTNLLYSFGRTENIPYGFLANLTSGRVGDHFRPRWYVAATLAAGNRIEGLGYGAGKLSFSGSPGGGHIDLGILKLQTLYFTDILHLGDFRFRQFLKTEYTTGINRFSDDSIDFTAGESIRGVGYNHMVTGTQRLLLSLDTVAFTPWKAHGFTFALFTFADVDIIGSIHNVIFKQNYYSGLGLGVRIHSETIGIETVQVRFAWYPNLPLDHKAYSFASSGGKRILPIDFIRSKPEIFDY